MEKYINADLLVKWIEKQAESGKSGYDGCHALYKTAHAVELLSDAESHIIDESIMSSPDDIDELLRKDDEEHPIVLTAEEQKRNKIMNILANTGIAIAIYFLALVLIFNK